MMLNIEQWTPQQAWAVYQLVEQIGDQLLLHHRENFRYYRWRAQQLEHFCNEIQSPDGEESPTIEEWLNSRWRPGDPEPF